MSVVLVIKWMMITTSALAQLSAAHTYVTPSWQIGRDTRTVNSVAEALALPSGYKAIVADVERWKFTPRDEQANPALAIMQICAIAHARNERCIAAPGLDLFRGPSGYLASGVTQAAWSADGWEVQAQTLELHPAKYRAFVLAVKAQVHRVQPHVKIIAGLTTSDRIGHVTGLKLWHAYASVRYHVAGFWGNVPKHGPKCPTCGAVNPGPLVYVLRRAYPNQTGPSAP